MQPGCHTSFAKGSEGISGHRRIVLFPRWGSDRVHLSKPGRGRMSDARGISVLAICGSLRAGSYNRAALRTAIELKPSGMTIETAEIGSIPLYNEDVRAQGFPPPVETLRRQIAAADALLFVTPEYNYSIPGVLKNAIDWGL